MLDRYKAYPLNDRAKRFIERKLKFKVIYETRAVLVRAIDERYSLPTSVKI